MDTALKNPVVASVGTARYLASIMDDREMVILSVEDLPNCWVFQGYAVWHRGELSKAGTALADEVIEKLAEAMRTSGW